MKRILFLIALGLTLFMVPAVSLATNGAQLIGVGSTQKAMGGAVTAAPEDAMTAITNPAGMATVGNRADFNGEAFIPLREMDFRNLVPALGGPGDDTGSGSKLYAVPALGWTAPAFNRDDMFFGGGFFATAGLGVDYPVISAGSIFEEAEVFTTFLFAKVNPAVGWKVNDRLSVGAGLNLDWQLLEIRETFGASALAGVTGNAGLKLDLGRAIGVYGGGFNVGAIYKVSDMLTVGASYISKQWFPDVRYRVKTGDIENFPDGNFLARNSRKGTYRLDLDFPQQAAVGLAYHPNAALTLELDIKWINWSDTHDNVELAGDFDLFDTRPATFGTVTSAKDINLAFGWDDQWVVALGVRYMLNEDWTFRIGWNWAESPIEEEDVFFNIALPAIVEHHLGLGTTYNFGPHWAMTCSFMWAFENDIDGADDVPQAFRNLGFPPTSETRIELEEFSLGLQLSYRW